PHRSRDTASFELLQEQLLALALVAHPAVEVDERPDLIVVDGGGGDDIAAVGVADEHDRTAQSAQELGEIGGVASEIAKRGGQPHDGVPAATQGADLGIEARRVGPGTVNQDDRRGLSSHLRRLPFWLMVADTTVVRRTGPSTPSHLRSFENRRSAPSRVSDTVHTTVPTSPLSQGPAEARGFPTVATPGGH